MWAFGAIAVALLLAAIALWIAVKWHGPAVLDTIDRIAGPARSVERVHRERIGQDPAQKVMVFRETGAEGTLPVVIFVHGGSWSSGDPDDYGFIARNLAPEGFVVVLAGYRLGEAGRYPVMLRDTASAVSWTQTNIARFGGDPARIVLAGHSAGAYNVAQIALDSRWLNEADAGRDRLRGIVGLSGPYDFYPFNSDSSRAAFASVGAGPDSQPVNHVGSDAPPFLLVHGEGDTIVKPRNARALAERLASAGSPADTLLLPRASHNTPLLALAYPWRRDPQVFDTVVGFMHRVTRVSVPVQGNRP